LLAVMFVSQLNTIAAVIMADLMKLFPDASPTAIQMVMQFGMVGAFPVTLSIGFFTSKFRIKPMICIGLSAIIIGGLIPLLAHSALIQLYISAVLIGAGQGFMAPLVSTLTLRHFEGRPRERQIGFNATFATGGATIVTLVAGVVALTGWLNIFFIYFCAVPALILVIVLMPLGDKPVPAAKVQRAKVPFTGAAFIIATLLVIMYLGYVTFPINVGMLVDVMGIGNAASTGVSVSIITVVGALFGLIFPYVVRIFKSYIGAFSCLFGTIGMLVVLVSANMGMIYFASVLLGLFFGSSIAGTVYIIGRVCKPEHFGPTLSITLGLMTLGVVLSPVVVNGVTALWGGAGSMGAFTTSAFILGIALVAQLVWGAYVKRNYPERAPAPAEEGAVADGAAAEAGTGSKAG